jgi:hypothetical protein
MSEALADPTANTRRRDTQQAGYLSGRVAFSVILSGVYGLVHNDEIFSSVPEENAFGVPGPGIRLPC